MGKDQEESKERICLGEICLIGRIFKTTYHTERGELIFDIYGRNEEREKFHLQVLGTEPYFFIEEMKPSLKRKMGVKRIEKSGETLEGDQLYKVVCHTPADVGRIRKAVEPHYEADILYRNRVRFDNGWKQYIEYPEGQTYYSEDDIKSIDYDGKIEPRVCVADIEVWDERGQKALDSKSATEELVSTALYDSYLDKYCEIFKGKYKGEDYKRYIDKKIEQTERNIIYNSKISTVPTEKHLFNKLHEWFKKSKMDIITGWNFVEYDFEYIQNRARQIMTNQSNWLDMPVVFDLMVANDKITRKTIRNTLEAQSQRILGVGKLDTPPIHKMYDENRDLAVAYNLLDTILTKEIEDYKGILDHYTNLSSLCGIDIDLLFRQSNIAEGYIFHKLHEIMEERGMEIRLPSKEFVEGSDSKLTGGYVAEAEKGMFEFMGVVDYKSEYPMIILENNISPETYVEDPDPDKDYYVSPHGNHYKKEPRGIIPTILEELLEERDKVKKKMKKAKSEGRTEDFQRLNNKQAGIKIVMNAFYGLMATPGGTFRLANEQCSKDITAFARNHIKFTMKALKDIPYQELNKYLEDSIFDILPIDEDVETLTYDIKYSDSLDYERRIIVKGKDGIEIVKIGEFVEEYNCKEYKTPSMNLETGESDFCNVLRGIRHSYNYREKGRLLKIDTTRGKTIVTPQHSVYKKDGDNARLVDAKELSEGDKLISGDNLPSTPNYQSGDVIDLAKLNYENNPNHLVAYKKDITDLKYVGDKCPYCKKKNPTKNHIYTKHPEKKTELDKVNSEYEYIGVLNGKGGKIPRFWELNEKLAWVLGYFCADGSASTGDKQSLSFGCQEPENLRKIQAYFNDLLDENYALIEDVDKRTGNKIYYYRVNNKSLVSAIVYGLGLGKGADGKKVPNIILNSEESIRKAFLEGYLQTDGSYVKDSDERYQGNFRKVSTKSKELALGVNYLLKTIEDGKGYGYNGINQVYWNYRDDKPDMNALRTVNDDDKFCGAQIRNIEKVKPSKGYVYDIEVEDKHNFMDAEGNIVVHNTDSVFIKLKAKTYANRQKEIKAICKYLNERYNEFVRNYGGEERRYLKIEPDKVYRRWLQGGAKKRYAGMLEWKDVDMRDKEYDERLEVAGFETERANTSEIEGISMKKVMKMALTDGTEEDIMEYLSELRDKIYNGEKDLELGIEAVCKPLEEYDDPDSQAFVRAWKWANNHGYDIDFNEPYIWWWCENGDTKAIPLFEDEIHEDIHIDYDRMWERNIENKLQPILECVVGGKFDMQMFLSGRKPKGLSDF